MTAPNKIGVVGAGTMGSGIAQKIAQSGMPVVLMDIGDEQVQAGIERIRTMLQQGVDRKVFKPEVVDQVLGRITPTTDPAAMRDCDLVVEAVFENLDIKRKLFATLEQHLRPDAVLASNTSSFKVAAIAEGARHPERIVGLHYFYHPAKNRLLEVIPTERTDERSLAAAWTFAEAHGKTAIHSADAPGFVVNRFFVPWLTESVRLLEEGAADIPTIERVARDLFGIGMGPFELMNVTGVPIAMHAADGLASELGPFYRAADRLRRQVEAGKNWPLDEADGGGDEHLVRQRLLGVVLLVAASLVEEGVSSVADVEIGAKVGLRWPVGPFSLANRTGVEQAVRWAEGLARRWDLPLPRAIAERLAAPKPFAVPAVSLAVERGVARITMNRPEALNALDPDTVADLARAFDRAAADPAVSGIIIEGRGKAFVAGADIKYFVKNIDAGRLEDIVAFTRAGHELLLRIDRCPKPVVARLNGLALGGGAELALACDAIVADRGAALGFPETGIGIYPGLGGTQRLAKRCGLGVARYLVLTGDIVPAERAAELGMVDRVAPAGTSGELALELLAGGGVPAGPGAGELARPQKKAVAELDRLFDDANTAAMLAGRLAPTDAFGQKVVRKLAAKAPVAMRISNQLITEALDAPIEQGVEMELASLPEIFATRDARTGLGSVGRGRPEFEGK